MAEYPILAGAEPFYFEGSEIGVLVLHGFTGTTQSMFFLGQYLAEKGEVAVEFEACDVGRPVKLYRPCDP